jgi:hypothetical protein
MSLGRFTEFLSLFCLIDLCSSSTAFTFDFEETKYYTEMEQPSNVYSKLIFMIRNKYICVHDNGVHTSALSPLSSHVKTNLIESFIFFLQIEQFGNCIWGVYTGWINWVISFAILSSAKTQANNPHPSSLSCQQR